MFTGRGKYGQLGNRETDGNKEGPGGRIGKSMYNLEKWAFLLNAPFKISKLCCHYTKEEPLNIYSKSTKRKPITAIMASESLLRKTTWIKYGCNIFGSNRSRSTPMAFWTEDDVLHYIRGHDLPIASVYGKILTDDEEQGQQSLDECDECKKMHTTGAQRTGCMYCLYGANRPGDKRLLLLNDSHPDIYDYVMRGGKWNDDGYWIPDKGLGYWFVIAWLRSRGVTIPCIGLEDYVSKYSDDRTIEELEKSKGALHYGDKIQKE